jgi:acetyl-CoA acyltransferase
MNAYIVAGYRTAVTRANKGGFRFTRPDELGARVIKHLLAQLPGFDPARVDDLIVGNAIPEGEQGLNFARYIGLGSLPVSVPAVTVNRYCASGLEAIAIASAKINAGLADAVIAGGAESMSLIPMGGYKISPSYEMVQQHADYYWGMGLTAEAVAQDYKISREEADAFALASHQKAVAAIAAGAFKNDIVPVNIEEVFFDGAKCQTKSYTVDTDEGPRADSNLAALGKLRPVFAAKGVVTAGNSSPTNDGASFVLVVSEAVLKEFNLKPRLQLKACASAGVEPRIMGIGPVAAIPKALKQAGLTADDMDVIELNEAFATQSLAVIRTLELNTAKINPNGGAIALGHPLGMTGSKLTVQVMNHLDKINGKYGMVTACVGGGQGIAGIFERIS